MMLSTWQLHLEKSADAELLSTWQSHLGKSAEAEFECWRLQMMMMRLCQQQYISYCVAESGVRRLAFTLEEIKVMLLSLADEEIEETSHSLTNEEIDVVSRNLMDEEIKEGNTRMTWLSHWENSADAEFESRQLQMMVMMRLYQQPYISSSVTCRMLQSGMRRLALTGEVSYSLVDKEIEVVSSSDVHEQIKEGHEMINDKRTHDSFVQYAQCVRCKWVCSEPFIACSCNDPVVIYVPFMNITKRASKVKNGCARCSYRGSCVHFSAGRYDVLVGGALCFCSRICRKIWFAERGGMIAAKKRVRAWSLA